MNMCVAEQTSSDRMRRGSGGSDNGRGQRKELWQRDESEQRASDGSESPGTDTGCVPVYFATLLFM